MKKLFPLVVFLLITQLSFAAHLIGYDMRLINIKDANGAPTSQYKFLLNFYRDVVGPGMPTSFVFTIVRKDNHTAVQNITLSKTNTTTYLTYDSENCPPAQAQLRHELGIYESSVINGSSFSVAQGYYIYGLNSTRNTGIKNVLGESSNYTMLMTMDFPKLNSGATMFNSSPAFNKKSLNFFSLGKPQSINMQVVDVDGDSLVYSLVKPLNNGSTQPFNEVPLADGYNLNYNIIDGAPDITINPITGILSFTPNQLGRYVIAIKVKEYRKINGVHTLIGEVRREMQIEIVHTPELPPEIEQSIDNSNIHLTDTILFPNQYTVNFTARDYPTDSLFMFIMPNISPGENLFDPNTYEARWGEIGFLNTGQAAINTIIEGQGIVQGQFKWTPKCSHIRDKPYEFKVIVRDKTCPSNYYDTMYVTLYVTSKTNSQPVFVSPDTIKTNNYVKRYYTTVGDVFNLSGDSLIKTYDRDSTQTVSIQLVLDDLNGSNFNNSILFSSTPNIINSTAILNKQISCDLIRVEPYRIKIIAFDNYCVIPDTISYTIEIYVKDKFIPSDDICAVTIDSSNNYIDIYWNRNISTDVKFHHFYYYNDVSNSYEFFQSVSNDGTQKLRISIAGFNSWPIRLKMANVNECGNRTAFSDIHSLIYLTHTVDSNNFSHLTWTPYVGGNMIGYKVLKKGLNSIYTDIATVNDTVLDYKVPTNDSAFYKIEVQRTDSCFEISPNNLSFSVYSNEVSNFKTNISNEKKSIFTLYPNPSSTIVNIVNSTSSTAKYILMDIHGKELQHSNFQQKVQVTMIDYPAGLYFIKINTDKESVNYKIIKQ